jgi:hypothetical protein
MSADGAVDRALGPIAALLVLMCLGALLVYGTGEPGVRVVVRAPAPTSALALCLALCSWVIEGLAARRATLVRSLAVSHGLHLAGIVWLAAITGGANLRERAELLTVAGGLLAYAVIFYGALRPRHPFVEWGLVWVGVSFLAAYGPRAARAPLVYGPAVVALAVCLVLRVAAPFVRPAAASAKEDLAT